MWQTILDAMNDDGHLKGSVHDGPHAFAIRRTLFSSDRDVIGLSIELGLVGIREAPGCQDFFDGLAEVEKDRRIWPNRRRVVFALRLCRVDLCTTFGQAVATLVQLDQLVELRTLDVEALVCRPQRSLSRPELLDETVGYLSLFAQ